MDIAFFTKCPPFFFQHINYIFLKIQKWNVSGRGKNLGRVGEPETNIYIFGLIIKWHVHPEKTRISLGIRPVWSESLLALNG